MRSSAVLNEMLAQSREKIVPPQFATTNRICERWAVSVGLGLPTDYFRDDDLISRPPPLDDDTATVVDQIILKCPPKTKQVVVKWYRTDLPDEVIAQQLGLTPRAVGQAWLLALNFLQWRFIESKHRQLLALLRFRD